MIASDHNLPATAVARARSFYARALTEAERIELGQALQVEGLDEEIALLRLRLQQVVANQPGDLDLMFKGTALLARLVATKYRLSAEDAADLEAVIRNAIGQLREMEPEANDEC